MAVLPRDCRLRRAVSEQEFGFTENLLLGIFDFLKQDAYYNMVSAGTSVDKKTWRQVVAGAPKSVLQTYKASQEEQETPQAEYVHPRHALTAVRRMISQKAYNQVYGSK